MGYDVRDKALVVNAEEATTIRTIFAEYLTAGSVRVLSERLAALDIVSKQRTNRHGAISGGAAFSRGALYNILRNPIYIGKTRHKEDLHDGLHDAIIEDSTWRRVQTQLSDHGGKKINADRRSAKRFMDGVLCDSKGRTMRTTYASKSVHKADTIRTKKYWYYTTAVSDSKGGTEIERFPADEIERVVLNGLKMKLADTGWLADQINGHANDGTKAVDILRVIGRFQIEGNGSDDSALIKVFPTIANRIDAMTDQLRISINFFAMAKLDADNNSMLATFDIPFQRRQNGRAKPITIAAKDAPLQDHNLIALVADARRWASELLEGNAASVQQITDREGLRSGSVSRILPLAWLAPDISTAILEGRQPTHLTAKALRNLSVLPADWVKQRQILGFAHL